MDIDTHTATFNRLRPRLQGIAYRMLGASAEAEELVQDVWLRWNDADKAAIDSAEAWLVTTTTRLSIDRLRSAKVQREHYAGIWLPEPLLTDSAATPEGILERADDMSMALMMLLERLGPEARAAYLMREVFDADYADVARMIGKTEAASRQIVHRARAQLQSDKPRYIVAPET
ncbi:MAG: sigma-70 family RNA polymerase sigma factor, partial [Haliea sp.]